MSFWDSFYGGLREVFWFAVRHVMGYGGSLLGDGVEALSGYFPDNIAAMLSEFSVYIDIANAWVPIDIGVGLFGVWLSARLAVSTARHIIKMIPTVG